MTYTGTYQTPIGSLSISETEGKISEISFQSASQNHETPLIKEAHRQISQYFAGQRQEFDLPLLIKGTPFQEKVWHELQKIPFGQTISYQELAIRAGNPKACRAVGGANNKNNIAIVIPCHRVIGKSGKLTGYAGGLKTKEFLLTLEG